ncbi:MAG TPA: hypothetical protein VFT83_02785 [Nitrososphaeraceae archaeon]|nr:hypothetical protein [Nitrososphaeraceae archaeon]
MLITKGIINVIRAYANIRISRMTNGIINVVKEYPSNRIIRPLLPELE